MTEREGVVKYQLSFSTEALGLSSRALSELNACRSQLVDWEIFGQDEQRYGGLGFGNISVRDESSCATPSFFISGTQTGELAYLSLNDIACVIDFNVEQNSLWAKGGTPPSSEAMTHAVIYDVDSSIQTVIHVHSPDIWNAADKLGLAYTESDIPYGTPEMAKAVHTLVSKLSQNSKPIFFAMKGHHDGVVVAGDSYVQCLDVLEVALSRTKPAISTV